MTEVTELREIKLPSTGRLAALTALALFIGLTAVPIPAFSRLTNDLRAFAGAGLALWAIDRWLKADGLGLRALLAEAPANNLRARFAPVLKTYALYLAFMLGAVFLLWGLMWAAGQLSGGGNAGAEAYTSWVEAGNAEKGKRLGDAGGGGGAWRLLWVLFLAPVLEELFFRRLLYVWLRRRAGRGLATAVSAGLFALFHAPVPLLMIVTGLLGVFLCRLYERQKDYGACVAMHALNNSLAFALFWALGAR